MKKRLGMILLLITLVISACGTETAGTDSPDENTDALTIYTTVYPIQFFAEQIAGEAANVTSILPPGADAHTFEPTTKEMVEIAEADAFIYNGAGLEAYAEKIADAIESENVEILEASNGIDLKEHTHEGENASEEAEHAHEEGEDAHEEGEHAHEEDEHAHEEAEHAHEEDEHAHEDESAADDHEGHNHGEQDPHIWLDPMKSAEMAENIKNLLVEMSPEQEELFNQNYEDLKQKLTDLDQQFHDELKDKPKREIIVSHAAYGYWEQAYGLEQLAVSGLSPTNEPSQKELEQIIQTAKDHDLKHVLFEQNITPKVSEVVQNEIGADPLRIHNLSVLTEEDIADEEDYFSLMHHNLEQLNEALSE
ncbi:adhesin [Halobacillus fulvus]|nr:adhesin [Halobacillus fulvus]